MAWGQLLSSLCSGWLNPAANTARKSGRAQWSDPAVLPIQQPIQTSAIPLPVSSRTKWRDLLFLLRPGGFPRPLKNLIWTSLICIAPCGFLQSFLGSDPDRPSHPNQTPTPQPAVQCLVPGIRSLEGMESNKPPGGRFGSRAGTTFVGYRIT